MTVIDPSASVICPPWGPESEMLPEKLYLQGPVASWWGMEVPTLTV